MTILTIYNHGTGGASSKDAQAGEIVNIFGNAARSMGSEFVDWVVTEGVGAVGSPDRQLWTSQITVDNATGESRLNLMQHKVAAGKARVDDYLKSAGTPWLARKLMPRNQSLQISGIGADENVASILSLLKVMSARNTLPEAINLMGWSRGGVTCIRIAYFMNLDPRLKHIPINIFAVDPVAGEGHDREPEARHIGANVKNYVATLSVHENRKGFTPMTLTRNTETSLIISEDTRYAILPLPGLHSDTAKFQTASGKLTFHLCYQFLTQHGTKISETIRALTKLNVHAQLWEYDKLIQGAKVGGIKTGHTNMTARFITGRARREVHEDIASNHQRFFINAHHRVLFEKKYPKIYQRYFTGVQIGMQRMIGKTLADESMAQEFSEMGPGHYAAILQQTAAFTPTGSDLDYTSMQCVKTNHLAE
ncbi:hypothetical protein WM40_07525 [Robbsia andropogonis]|uniref:DUF5621 domain-containing protein n=1 Tax=Robbsia andropogonis TaxID=28092 RepID=A0A0F5K345_9BURK|nr:hypothetical protein [Robbsia andropogonis]KKB64299.1 hypothetical protein WM40_07525 [Robbsia andropogonis]